MRTLSAPSLVRAARPAPLLVAALVAAPATAQWSTVDDAASFDSFGAAVAVGDFDDDGFDDLAVGIPGEDALGVYGSGAVRVYYGGPAGFGTGGEDYFAQGLGGFPSTSGFGDALGTTLAVGDFNADGVDDLAIGAPGEKVGPDYAAGAVYVLFGYPGIGPTGSFSQAFHQDTPGVLGGAEAYDRFGSALCAADFDGDGADDLAIGVPDERIGSSKNNAGAVNVLFGSAEVGLTAAGDQIWYEDLAGVAGTSKAWDRFGAALAAGDFDGDGLPDLAIGTPGTDTYAPASGWATNSGTTLVLFSQPLLGPTTAGQRILYPASTTSSSFAFSKDAAFGSALAAGDYNLDGRDDLAIGAPRETTVYPGVGVLDAGVVHVFFGDPVYGIDPSEGARFHQDSPGVGGVAEPYDGFGATLATGSFDFTGLDALIVGVPDEDIGSLTSAGAAHVFYPGTSGPKTSGSQLFYQNVGGVEGVSGANDEFGGALAAGDVTGDGIGDLVIGIPGEDVSSYDRAGAVGILRGTAENGVTTANDLLIHEFVWFFGSW